MRKKSLINCSLSLNLDRPLQTPPKKMIHHEKIKEVHNYLEKDLSGKTPEYKYDASQKAAIFTLRIDENTVTISMLEEFFDDNGINEIKKKLKDFRLLEFVRHGWSKQITVTKFGLKLEDF